MLPPPVRSDIAADRSHINAAAAGFGVDHSADIVDMNASAAALGSTRPAMPVAHQIAAFGFNFHQTPCRAEHESRIRRKTYARLLLASRATIQAVSPLT